MQNNKSRSFLISLCSLILVGCATRHENMPSDSKEQITTLKQLRGLARGRHQTVGSRMSGIRLEALKETALSVGAQGGLAERSHTINEMLERNSNSMDRVYDFNLIILPDNVLPPVLLEGRRTLNNPDAQTLRVADRSYLILRQARFATTPPNWREYLWMNYKYPDKPDFTLIPKNDYELKIWNKYCDIGWERGAKQAHMIFNQNLARLKMDFVGMVRYRKLLANHMVTPPYVAKTELGVTGGGDRMRIDDRVLRIAALPQLIPEGREWKSNIAKDRRVDPSENIMAGHGWNPVINP